MKKTLTLTRAAGALLAAGLLCSAGIARADAMTDTRLLADHAGYRAQQAAIKALNDTGKHPVSSYALAKAQCWLDVSFHEYTRNDRSDFPQLAFDESRKITDFLAGGGSLVSPDNPALKTPLLNEAARLRDDLWALGGMFKSRKGWQCAQAAVACGEVELVHAGNEYQQQGWRHAKPYIQIAEDLIGSAEQSAAGCPDNQPPKMVAAPAPAPVVVPAPAPVTIERLVLGANALFAFDRRTEADILPGGRDQLAALAAKLTTAYAHVDSLSITLKGYTDRLGTPGYNAQLSQDRAAAVMALMKKLGIKAPITAQGMGSADPVVECVGNGPSRILELCLQPNRRVEIEIKGNKR